MIARSLIRSGWTPWHLVGSGAMVAIAVFAMWDVWSDIYHIASRDPEATQVFLVPFVVAWLVLVRWGRLRLCRPRASLLGPLAVALGWLISTIGYHHDIQSFWHGGAVMVAIGGLLTIMGRDLLVQFFPAFAVLVFLVPIPGTFRQALSIPLQKATATVARSMFDVLDIVVEQSGNVLNINGKPVEIAEACNGMRGVFMLVLVSYTFAFITPLRNSVRLVMVLASPILAILCNVMRLMPTVWLYGNPTTRVAHGVKVSLTWLVRMFGGSSETPGEVFHDVSGWLMIPLAFIMLLGIIRLLRWAMVPVSRFNLVYDY